MQRSVQKRVLPLMVAVAVLGAIVGVGAATFLHPCRHADGSQAICAAAGCALTAAGLCIALIALVGALVQNARLRLCCAALCALGGAILILIPGMFCPLCLASAMRCRTVTAPSARVAGVLIALLSLVQLALCVRRILMEKKA